MNDIFHALASTHRRRMLDIIRDNPGCSVAELCRGFDVSRIAVMKHLATLQNAGLIISEKHGRKRALYFNAVPIQMIYERWSSEYSALWAGELTAIKYRLEGAS